MLNFEAKKEKNGSIAAVYSWYPKHSKPSSMNRQEILTFILAQKLKGSSDTVILEFCRRSLDTTDTEAVNSAYRTIKGWMKLDENKQRHIMGLMMQHYKPMVQAIYDTHAELT